MSRARSTISRNPRRWLALATVIAALPVGCSSGDGKGHVNGVVTLDGTPLKEGAVRFVSLDGQSPTAGATIADGRFAAAVSPGAMRVEVSAPKVVGKQKMIDAPGAREVDVVEELLPARYNVKSELTMEVQAGEQEHLFELKSN